MPDNIAITAGAGTLIAADQVTYSGDTSGVQLMRPVDVLGSEGSKTVVTGITGTKVVSAASTNATNIKSSPGKFYGCHLFNKALYPIWLKLHNTAGVPTAGSGVVYPFAIQAGQPLTLNVPLGIPFATGIAYTLVKGAADNNNEAVEAEDVTGVIYTA